MPTELTFEAWPKIARLNRDVVISEKIDGTNAAVIVTDDGAVGAQSRKRLITITDDNFGFARWVDENADALVEILGPGRHFGEWWGSGIQRGYGLTNGEKRFSLFNVNRYADVDTSAVTGLGLVPVLYDGPFDTRTVSEVLSDLADGGSVAAPGFPDPEGIVVFHSAAQTVFKVTIKGDEAPKSLAERAA
jgi:hypothetical protein